MLIEAWDDRRAQLRPLTLRRLASGAEAGGARRRPAATAAAAVAFAGLPPLAEHTPVLQTPLGPVLQSAAVWTGTSGGFEVS